MGEVGKGSRGWGDRMIKIDLDLLQYMLIVLDIPWCAGWLAGWLAGLSAYRLLCWPAAGRLVCWRLRGVESGEGKE